MIEFFRFKQIKILGNNLKYPESEVGVFRGYYGFKIARLVEKPETFVIFEDTPLETWKPITVKKDSKRFFRSENSRRWNNLYSEDFELLCKIYLELPKVAGPEDMGEFEPLVPDRFLILV